MCRVWSSFVIEGNCQFVVHLSIQKEATESVIFLNSSGLTESKIIYEVPVVIRLSWDTFSIILSCPRHCLCHAFLKIFLYNLCFKLWGIT